MTDWWDKAGTIATVGATLVALAVPLWLDRLQRMRQRDTARNEFRGRTLEILRAADEAAFTHNRARIYVQEITPDIARESTLLDLAERGSRAREVLIRLIDRQDLSDGVVRLGVDAAALGGETSMACERALVGGDIKLLEARNMVQRSYGRELRIRAQVEHLQHYHKLPAIDPADHRAQPLPCN